MTELDIVAFLTEQYDADEAIARDASNLQEDSENGWGSIPRPDVGTRGAATITPHIGLLYESESVAHVVRFNPARVLADIAAKRELLLWHEEDRYRVGRCSNCHTNLGQSHLWPCHVVKLLAAPYAGQPGYNPAWAVG